MNNYEVETKVRCSVLVTVSQRVQADDPGEACYKAMSNIVDSVTGEDKPNVKIHLDSLSPIPDDVLELLDSGEYTNSFDSAKHETSLVTY